MSKAMKSEKQALVPQLRFPEFRDAGEWALSNLGKLFENRQEAGFESLPLLSLTYKDGIIPQEESNRKNNASADKSRYLRVVPGDIAYNTMRMWEGRSAYVDREGIISPAYTVCKPKGSVNGLFYSYYFKTNQLIEQFRRYSQGLVKDTLNLKYAAFSQIPALAPKSKEQQKIADCLSSLDALIAAQADKIDALKTHKNGLMQQLFPREGETVPRLRFPEFRDAGEWEEKSISEIGEVVTGSTPSTSDKSLYGGRVMFVSPADISDQCFVTRTAKTLTEKGLSKARIIPARSTLFVCIGSTIGKIAQNKYECATNQQINSVIPFDNFLNDFVYYALEFASERIAEMAGRQAVPIINKSLFSTALLNMPVDKGEQKAVADCLSSLDDLIVAHTEKLDALKNHKQGLIQQLFPIVEGVVS